MANKIEFEKLQFKKNWNNASDFPTFEDDEAKVRADMQALHDETRDFLNDTLIPSVEETLENLAVPGTGDMKAEVYDPTGQRKDIYQYVKDVSGGYKAFKEGEEPQERGETVLYGKILADYREVKNDG